MRIIAVSTLRDFWEKYPDSEQDLKSWNAKIRNSNFENCNQIKADTPSSDYVGNNRVVYNICHNKYRLIVIFRLKLKRVYIRFLGIHKEYDKINDIKNI
jgi:mRNA interferase HigB